MSLTAMFNIQLALGYVAWLLCFGNYGWPRLRRMARTDAHRAIATLHCFRFFGLVFVIPGVVGADLPPVFASYAAYGDLATGLLALMALLTARMGSLFWFFVVAFNVVGTIDLLGDYFNAVRLGLPAMPGQLGSTYVIPIIYVPILMITHVAAFLLLARGSAGTAVDGG